MHSVYIVIHAYQRSLVDAVVLADDDGNNDNFYHRHEDLDGESLLCPWGLQAPAYVTEKKK